MRDMTCSLHVSQLSHFQNFVVHKNFVARDIQLFLGDNRDISCLFDSEDMLLACHSYV